VLHPDEDRPLMLTAAHVVGSLSLAHPLGQREVLLGAAFARPSSGDPRIGDVIASHPAEPSEEVQIDASLVRVDEHVTLTQLVRDRITSGRPRDLSGVDDLVTVFKRGINTPRLTRGLLDPTPEAFKVVLPQSGGGGALVRDYLRGWFVYGDGVPFAQPGDSGSIIVDEDDCVVAMLVALRTEPHRPPRPEDPAFVVPILDVLDGLGVSLAGPDRPCTLS
jgi:hypothetical protein